MGKKCISIVVPMYNEQESLQILYRELNRVTREMGDYDFEYLFVNDGSKDATLQKIRELAAEDERVHYLSFSRNFGKEAGHDFLFQKLHEHSRRALAGLQRDISPKAVADNHVEISRKQIARFHVAHKVYGQLLYQPESFFGEFIALFVLRAV